MRLIDSEKLTDRIDDYWDWETLGPTMAKLLKATINEIRVAPEVKAIPIEWLHKELIDLMYDGKATEDVLHVFHRLIGKWEKQNETVHNVETR